MIDRRPVKGLATAGILVLAAASAWADTYYNGIDVSHWQGSINWTQVHNSGVSFAFMKATQGVDYTDPTFQTNIQSAHDNGILAGPYHFATPFTDGVNDAVAEADWFVDHVNSYLTPGHLRPVVDVEQGSGLGKTVLSAWVCDFENRVKQRTGIEPIIYCNTNYATNYLNSTVANYTLWIANWTYDTTKQPGIGVFHGWAFWQWSNQTSVPGILGNVDGDVCRVNPNVYAIPLSGDANLDGSVDITDLSSVLTNYNRTGMTWAQGDFTGNGIVDIDDLSKVLANYSHTALSGGATLHAVAEPSCAGVLLGGVAGVFVYVRCRRRLLSPKILRV
jgi:GH25 family lysozyme M1 (1,4-beta-N-acetylmuramidase)